MPAEQHANDAGTELHAAVTASQTTVAVVSASGFPQPPFRILVGTRPSVEIMLVEAASGTSWMVRRAAEDPSRFPAYAHPQRSPVDQIVTREGLERLLIVQDEGVDVGYRRRLNFVGPGVGVIEDAARERLDVYVAGAGFTRSAVEAYRAAAFVAVTASYTDLPYDVEVRDELDEYDPTTGVFTAREAGWYLVNAQIAFDGHVDNQYAFARIVSAGGVEMVRFGYQGTALIFSAGTTTLVNLAAGGTLKVQARNNSASDRGVIEAAHLTFLKIRRID